MWQKKEPQGLMEWISYISAVTKIDANKFYEMHCETPREGDMFKELLAHEKYYLDWISVASHISFCAAVIALLTVINGASSN